MIKALKICGYVSAAIWVINACYLSLTIMSSVGILDFIEFISGLAGGALSLIGFLSLAKHLENKEEIKRLLSEISQKLDTENNGTWGYYTE